MHSLNAEPRACVGRTPVNGEKTMRHISLLLCCCVAAAALPGCAPPTGHPPRNDDRRVETTCKWLADADPEVRVRAAVTLEMLGPRVHAGAACLSPGAHPERRARLRVRYATERKRITQPPRDQYTEHWIMFQALCRSRAPARWRQGPRCRGSGEVANSRCWLSPTACGFRASVAGAGSPPWPESGDFASNRPGHPSPETCPVPISQPGRARRPGERDQINAARYRTGGLLVE